MLPYCDKRAWGYVAQFQLGFKKLNVTEIYERQIKSINYLTGKITLGERTSNKVVGYAAYMKLINGFAKMLYMTREDAERHAQNYFEIYRRDTGKGARTLIKRDC